MKKIGILLVAGALVTAAHADTPITVGSGWQAFTWYGLDTFNAEGAFTFAVGNATTLTVCDGYTDGDQFAIYDNSTLIGVTSVPANDGYSAGGDFTALLSDSRFSSGAFDLPSGSHSITIETIATATSATSGGAGFRLDKPLPTPEPASFALAGLGGLSLLAFRRKAA